MATGLTESGFPVHKSPYSAENKRGTGPGLMQIAYHIGANCTDEDRLLKTLLKNADTFAAQGIKVPGPGKYRRLLRETIQNLAGAAPAEDTRNILLDAILDDEEASRLVMSNSGFICIPRRIFEQNRFYALAEQKVRALAALFPTDDLELFMGIRNPATFIPACFAPAKDYTFADYLRDVVVEDLRWSEVIATMRDAVPDAQITVWCNEDTPLIYAQLVREISGVDPLTQIIGGFDLLAAIMSTEGMTRLLSYLKSHPPQTEIQKRRIIAAFLDKYALEDQIEEEVDLPGWTAELMNRLTEIYEEDIETIEHMPGINFIGP
jgi:hypothetical protein